MMIRVGGMPGSTVFPGPGGVEVTSGGGGVHADLPGKFSLFLNVGKQSGVYVVPYPASVEMGK